MRRGEERVRTREQGNRQRDRDRETETETETETRGESGMFLSLSLLMMMFDAMSFSPEVTFCSTVEKEDDDYNVMLMVESTAL